MLLGLSVRRRLRVDWTEKTWRLREERIATWCEANGHTLEDTLAGTYPAVARRLSVRTLLRLSGGYTGRGNASPPPPLV